jgi:toxin CptA
MQQKKAAKQASKQTPDQALIKAPDNMSIAVSAVVRPSPCLRLLQLAFCILAFGVGVLLALRQISCSWPLTGAGLSLLVALTLSFSLLKNSNSHRIDISGVGQIRLTVYQLMPGGVCADGTLVTLMPGSTLWPGLLLLHLRAENGVMVALPVLPDSVSAGLFRPLSVACRTIAARSGDLT